ncbi:sulfatase family protein [Nitrosopumilus sp.]|uniref:sulfatase family protein n=1 Tax=Nitrosopumilus sp. TaxID=2024843 RepID=UPI003D123FB2
MKPNILLLIIDGLRSDKCFGSSKTSKTPNIDFLIQNGTYFSQAISSSDGTRTCVGSILTGQYPFTSGLTTFHNHHKSTVFFDYYKKQNYSLFATVPDVDLWKTLTKNFDGVDLIPKPYEYLFGGTGKKILKQLDDAKNSQPWIYYVHIMDLHRSVNFAIPENFKDEQFGNNDYEKMVSGIDYWIGKFLEKIELKNTVIIITSDHGEFIPISSINHEITYMPTLVKLGQKIKKILPSYFDNVGLNIFLKIRNLLVPIKKFVLKSKYSSEEIRTLNIRGTKMNWELYDEVVRIPLLFSGYDIPTKIISSQVRQIDIFPTVNSILNIPKIVENIEGKSLLSSIYGEKIDDMVALMENQLLDPNDNDIAIGIRTPNYKYFRDISNKNRKTFLFDLKNDPSEKINIASTKPDIVQEMESLLSKHRKHENNLTPESDDEEISKIKDELKKMGYI